MQIPDSRSFPSGEKEATFGTPRDQNRSLSVIWEIIDGLDFFRRDPPAGYAYLTVRITKPIGQRTDRSNQLLGN